MKKEWEILFETKKRFDVSKIIVRIDSGNEESLIHPIEINSVELALFSAHRCRMELGNLQFVLPNRIQTVELDLEL